MEESETKQILLKVSAIWSRQPTDDVVQAEWAECLSRVSFKAALDVVRGYRDQGNAEPPTCGQIYRDAWDADARAERYRRQKQRQIEDANFERATPEQMARIRKLVADSLNKVAPK